MLSVNLLSEYALKRASVTWEYALHLEQNMTSSDDVAKLTDRNRPRPSREELFARLQSREPVQLSKTAAELIRDERDTRWSLPPLSRWGIQPKSSSFRPYSIAI